MGVNRLDLYINPPRMLFGEGAIEKIGEETKQIDERISRVQVITDSNIEKSGLLQNLVNQLKKTDLECETYICKSAEPTKKSILDTVKSVRANRPDAVIGFGGGSCMDTAKIVAVMLTNSGDLEEYLAPNDKKIIKEPLPTIMIPTTSGTGSEASNTAVVIDEKGRKTWMTGSKLLSKLALIDPTLTLSLPPRQTAGTGMDALSHAAEAVMSKQANSISDALSLEAIRLVSRDLRKAYHAGENLEARSNVALAATLGGWVIGFPWIGGPALLGHCASEGISARYNIPHGEACGVILPYVYEFNLPNCIDKLSMIASVMGVNTSQLSPREAAISMIRATFALLEDIDLPTALKEYDVPKNDIPDIVDYIIEDRQHMYDLANYNPRGLTKKNLTEFFEKAWEGKDSLGEIAQ